MSGLGSLYVVWFASASFNLHVPCSPSPYVGCRACLALELPVAQLCTGNRGRSAPSARSFWLICLVYLDSVISDLNGSPVIFCLRVPKLAPPMDSEELYYPREVWDPGFILSQADFSCGVFVSFRYMRRCLLSRLSRVEVWLWLIGFLMLWWYYQYEVSYFVISSCELWFESCSNLHRKFLEVGLSFDSSGDHRLENYDTSDLLVCTDQFQSADLLCLLFPRTEIIWMPGNSFVLQHLIRGATISSVWLTIFSSYFRQPVTLWILSSKKTLWILTDMAHGISYQLQCILCAWLLLSKGLSHSSFHL